MSRTESVEAALDQANDVFAEMRRNVEAAVKGKATHLDVLEIARKSGLEEFDEAALRELQLPRLIPCHRWLPWYYWWPWRPLWCWWWHRYHPWYGWCCPWWWHRCHWHPW